MFANIHEWQWLTLNSDRREDARLHETPENVKRVIRHAERQRDDVRVYMRGSSGGLDAFIEVPRADWHALFGTGV